MQTFEKYLNEKIRLGKLSDPSIIGKRKLVDVVKDKPSRKHKHKMVRGIGRKHQGQVPKGQRFMGFREVSPHFSSSAEKIVGAAKKANRGIWKASKRQVLDIAMKYKFNVPDERQKTKHLGSTGIQLWRRAPGEFFLIKTGYEGKQ